MKLRKSLFLVCILALGLTYGCGSSSSAQSTAAESAAPTEAVTEVMETAEAIETTEEAEVEDAEAFAEEGEDTGEGKSSSGSAVSAAVSKSTRKMTDIASSSLLPDSSTKCLTEKDIADLTPYQLRIARNEIYARHGRGFNDYALSLYFSNKTWYEATVEPKTFDKKADKILNKYEKANIALIKKRESAVSGQYYAGFKTTYKKIKTYSFTKMPYGDRTSALSFVPYFSSAKDCGDYYEIPCQIDRPAKFSASLKVGKSKTICCNDLTNESIKIKRVSSDEYQGNNGMSYFIQNGVLFDYYGSDDMVYFPCYVGKIRVSKNLLIGSGFGPETFNGSFKDYEGWSFNGVAFDENGYVTALIYYGD